MLLRVSAQPIHLQGRAFARDGTGSAIHGTDTHSETRPDPNAIGAPLRSTVTKTRWCPWHILVTFKSDAPDLPHLISEVLARIKR